MIIKKKYIEVNGKLNENNEKNEGKDRENWRMGVERRGTRNK